MSQIMDAWQTKIYFDNMVQPTPTTIKSTDNVVKTTPTAIKSTDYIPTTFTWTNTTEPCMHRLPCGYCQLMRMECPRKLMNYDVTCATTNKTEVK